MPHLEHYLTPKTMTISIMITYKLKGKQMPVGKRVTQVIGCEKMTKIRIIVKTLCPSQF